MMTTMTIENFEERAMAYGADIDGWPDEDQAAARALLIVSAEARAALEQARALDAMLDLWDGPQPSHALLSKVLADAATVTSEAHVTQQAAQPAQPRQGWLARFLGDRHVLRPGVALAACLAFGFVMGTTVDDAVLTPAPVTTTSVAAQMTVIDFAFAMEDDADLLLGPEAFL